MATLPPSVADLSAWVGQTLDEADARAVAVLSAASALVRGYAAQEWADDSAPADVAALVVQVAARVWFNPQGVTSETIDDYSRRFDGQETGLFLTESERTILNRYRASTSGLWVQPTTQGPLEVDLDERFRSDLLHGDSSGTYLPSP